MAREDPALRLSALRRLYALIARLNGGRGLAETLQAVVDGVVESLDFGVAVVNIVHPDGSFETVAVAGSDEAREQLLGNRSAADAFEVEFARAEHWGGLRFVPHDRLPEGEVSGWVPPDAVVSDDPDAWHPLDALFAPLYSPSGQLVGILSVDLPHDARRPGPLHRELLEMFAVQAGIAIDNARLAERLQASEEAFRLAFEGAGVGMTMISLDPDDPGRILRANEAMAQICGYSVEELTARTFMDITHPDDLGPDVTAMRKAIFAGEIPVYRAEKRYVRPDGSSVWVHLTTSAIRLASGQLLYGVTQVEDITARRAAEDELRHRAAHDHLTGLANRAALNEALEDSLGLRDPGGAAAGTRGALLLCDLDDFKPINDTHGHGVGDVVLQVVAGRLREQVRPEDLAARLGGDEFVVLAVGIDAEEARRLACRLEAAVSAPIRVDGLTVSVGVSIGVTPLVGEDVPTLLRVADRAMYRVKTARRRSGGRPAETAVAASA